MKEILTKWLTLNLEENSEERGAKITRFVYTSIALRACNAARSSAALAYIDQLSKAKVFSRPMVTQVVPLKAFYPAEQYHQNFLARHPDYPYIVFNDLPKLRELQKQFPDLYKK